MENNFGYIIALLLGLFCIIRFKELGKSTYKRVKSMPSMIPDKWRMLYWQISYLIVGSSFFILSLLKLLNIHIKNII